MLPCNLLSKRAQSGINELMLFSIPASHAFKLKEFHPEKKMAVNIPADDSFRSLQGFTTRLIDHDTKISFAIKEQ